MARTLVLNPEIMLYDEPTAGLDPITCVEINNLINEVRERYKTTSIVITHDLACAKQTGDRMAVLLDGQFGALGTFEEVFPMLKISESNHFTIITLFIHEPRK